MAIRTDRKTWIISICAVTLVFLVLTFDLVSMRCIFKWDAWYLFWPMFNNLVSALDLGRLPLWEPRACCGFPFHAEPQTGTFYPVFILVGLLAGGGFKGGRVVGASDEKGANVKERPVYPCDLIGSMYELLGIDPDGTLPHPEGQVVHVTPSADEGVKTGGRLREIM